MLILKQGDHMTSMMIESCTYLKMSRTHFNACSFHSWVYLVCPFFFKKICIDTKFTFYFPHFLTTRLIWKLFTSNKVKKNIFVRIFCKFCPPSIYIFSWFLNVCLLKRLTLDNWHKRCVVSLHRPDEGIACRKIYQLY